MPVPAQDLFQTQLGYGGSHHPWALNEGRGVKYRYCADQYPVAKQLCDTYTIVHGIHPPNGKDLMDKILTAFHRVFGDLDAVIAHADDAINPGADAGLYGAG